MDLLLATSRGSHTIALPPVCTLAENLAEILWKTEVFYISPLCSYFFQCLFIFERERERERESVSRGGAESEGDTESEAGSRL